MLLGERMQLAGSIMQDNRELGEEFITDGDQLVFPLAGFSYQLGSMTDQAFELRGGRVGGITRRMS